MPWIQSIVSSFNEDFQRWPLWIPVFVGIGISIYFSLYGEPNFWFFPAGFIFFFLTLFAFRLKTARLALLCAGLVALGFSAGQFRTFRLNTLMLHYPLPPLLLEGRVDQVELKPLKSGALYQRLILSHLRADTPENLPRKVRITMKGKRERLWPGQVIQVKAKLIPITGPSLPDSFDFRRHAFFAGIGATGFALSPPKILHEVSSWSLSLEKRREQITNYFLTNMTPPYGALAAALITGDKSSIPESTRESYTNAGLAHILAISGLHLTIIAGVAFLVFRKSIALIPPLSLRFNGKKIAALGTLLLTFLYLILSGFAIPAQRAFIMISLLMGAILIDRSALSMRTVVFAALVLLLFTPEALLSPSFQLSFSAVIALIAGYETFQNPLTKWIYGGGLIRKLILYLGGLVFTSLLATLATLPLTIYIFHHFSLHALEANLMAVPLTSLVIMPSALVTCFMIPFGLEEIPLRVFENSLDLLTRIANEIGNWRGANIPFSHPPLSSFILVIAGGLWLCLWTSSWRLWGGAAILLGGLSAFREQPPALLIDGQGKVAGIYDKASLKVSSLRKGKFTTETWQRHFGGIPLTLLPCTDQVCRGHLEEIPVLISDDKSPQPCQKGSILIRMEPSETTCPKALLTIDWFDLWRRGTHVIHITSSGLEVSTTYAAQGNRPWTTKPIPRKARPVKKAL